MVLILVSTVLLTACGGGAPQGGESGAPRPEQAPGSGSSPGPEAPAATGTIVGRVVDQGSGAPLSSTYIVVGYRGVQRAAITGPDGRYEVAGVPAGEPTAVLGFHDGTYRYHNSQFDAGVIPRLAPGQTFAYDFAVRRLDPAGQPRVSEPALTPEAVRAGDVVEFGLTVRGGRGGLSEEVFAASPELGRLVWLKPVGADRYQATFVVPPGTRSGEYRFAYFAASNDCYAPAVFPTLVLRVQA